MARVPEDVVLRTSVVPDHADLPYELLDAAVEAARTGRSDLLSVLVADLSVINVLTAPRPRSRRDGSGRWSPTSRATTPPSWASCRGCCSPTAGEPCGHDAPDGVDRVVVDRVEPGDLARELVPVLAEVSR